jgi:nucleoside-diphosphate-sugar epimerase
MSTTLVTGALGCIGAWVVQELLRRGSRPVVLDREGDPRRLRDLIGEQGLAGVEFRSGDITDLACVKDVLASVRPRAVIHLAGLQVPACRADPVLGARVNVLGTIHVFEAALAAGVERVVYASSAAVLGPDEDDARAFGEDAPCAPVTHYGVYKRANEECARVYWLERGLSSVGLRPLTVYGVGRDQGLTSGPTSAMKAAVLGRTFHIGFRGATDFLYAADAAAAFVACSERAAPGAPVYNLHGDTVDVQGVITAIEAELPAARGLITCGGPRIPIPARLDGAAIRAALPDLPRTPLEAGVRETLARFRALAAAGRLDTRDLPPAGPTGPVG